MSTLPSWAACLIIAALVLLSPALAFLMVIAAELVIDFAMEVGRLRFVSSLLALLDGCCIARGHRILR